MPVALAGRVPATFEIKSAQLPLVRLLLKSTDLPQLAQEFHARFGDLPDFFDQDPLLLDLSALPADAPAPDFEALRGLLRAHRLHAVAARGGSPALMAQALAAGLPAGDEARLLEAVQAASSTATATSGDGKAQALVVDRPLRAGQQVYARGRDLVLTAVVNPGAEVIADGHIHVYAPMRGRAIAGARGDDNARIFALGLQPELLAIAGVWRDGDVALPAELANGPVQVRLDGGSAGRLVITPLA